MNLQHLGIVLPIISGFASLFLALTVMFASRSVRGKESFVLFAGSMSVWAICIGLFLLIEEPATVSLIASTYYAAALSLAYGFMMFCLSYLSSAKHAISLRRYSGILAVPALILAVAVYVPTFLFSSVNTIGQNEISLQPFGYLLFSTVFLGYTVTGLYVIVKRSHAKRVDSHTKRQLKLLSIVMWIALPGGSIFNLFLPMLGNYNLIMIGPLFALVVVMAVFYAIMKHDLFDIKKATVRTIGYLFTLT